LDDSSIEEENKVKEEMGGVHNKSLELTGEQHTGSSRRADNSDTLALMRACSSTLCYPAIKASMWACTCNAGQGKGSGENVMSTIDN
jgi:hypothetical protein